jgi:hypothetical protein
MATSIVKITLTLFSDNNNNIWYWGVPIQKTYIGSRLVQLAVSVTIAITLTLNITQLLMSSSSS